VTPRDVERLRWQLTLGGEAAARLCRHLDDLHTLAFDKHVAGLERTSGTAWPPPGVEHVGHEQARDLWRQLCATATSLDSLLPLERAIANYFTAGPSPEPSRGAIISKGEFGAAQRHQRQRAAAGDYTPCRIEDQPGYGGGR
jgi:hypothetical protein